MKRFYLISLLLLLSSLFSIAQNYDKNWGIGIDYGSIEYRGELGDQLGDFSQWQGGYGIEIARYLSPAFNFGVRAGYNFLSVMGPDTNSFSMNGDMYTVLANVEYKLANGVTLPEDAGFKPYLKFGGGRMFGDTWGSSMDNNGDRYDLKLNDWIYSLSGGARIRLGKHIDGFVEIGNLWVTATGMDGSRMDVSKDQFIQLNVGLVFAMGQFKDADRDGVGDKSDQCPNTPPGVEVDELGCPLDSDGDGIPDFQDECPDEVGSIKTKGCPDRDQDEIADKYDKCPDEAGPKSNQGCPVEEKEKEEKVAAVPQQSGYPASGVNIFFVYPGNGQGMPQIYSMGQNQNMPFDSDGDGIANNIDKCPDQAGPVENYGCPDTSLINKSQTNINTAFAPASLDIGCPSDRDCDGISDEFDKCPDSPGAIRNKGCPIEHLSPEWKREYKVPPVHFMTGKSFLTDYSRNNVDILIKTLKVNQELNVWLFGHTDPRGSDDFNAKLSEDRLRTIVSYMVEQGIDKERIYTMAFGESFPASLGQTEDDLKRNRRVEFFLFEFK